MEGWKLWEMEVVEMRVSESRDQMVNGSTANLLNLIG